MTLSDAFDKILMEELEEEMMKDDKWLHDSIIEKEILKDDITEIIIKQHREELDKNVDEWFDKHGLTGNGYIEKENK